MKLNKRSILSVTVSMLLAACGSDTEPSIPMPDKPEPLVPAPAVPFVTQIGEVTVKATKEELVVTSNEASDKLATVESFKGIQYAEAERFKHSEVVNLVGDELDATQFGYACPQLKATAQEQSEDCLNLNIWRPANTDSDAALPVYVFIHGGDFEYGSGSEALVHGDTVVAQGSDDGKPFIYVSFNYRLGQLGTQWIEGANENGNYGLGDQKRALAWIYNNIADFGGDAQNVTVMGQGSGAMSIGFLQQDDDIAGQYFQRAIMQSNPYGFEYPSYKVAKERSKEFTADTSFDEIMASQKTTLNGIEQLKNWLLGSLQIPVLSPTADETPMSNLMPFAPYILCEKTFLGSCSESAESPIQTGFSVPTVLGGNAHEANSFGMIFNATFVIPTVIELLTNDEPELLTNEDPAKLALAMINWLEDENNIALLQQKLSERASDEVSAEITLPTSAYSAVTGLFYGAKIEGDLGEMTKCIDPSDIAGTVGCLVDIVDVTSHQQTQDILALTDFYPNSESSLGGALDNMKQFKTLLNDTLFHGPARYLAANSEVEATLYHFEHKPSFNMWNYKTALNEETGEYDQLSIIDLFKTIGCISGACNGSELPFMFNKAVRFDGSEVRPSSKEKALMNEMSRLWFSDELFQNYQYSDTDNVLVIDGAGFSENSTTFDWDYVTNPGVDPKLRNGRLTGLTEQGLMPWNWYLN